MKEDLRIQAVKSIFLLTIVLSLFTNCNGQKKAMQDMDTTESNLNSPLTLLIEGNYAPFESAENEVITNAKDLSKFFSKINRTRKPGIPVPEVDFSKNMVIIYCAGTAGNGTQPSLFVQQETADEVIFKIDNSTDKQKPTATVSPFIIYSMPISSKKVSFKGQK